MSGFYDLPEHVALLLQRVADGQASDQDLQEWSERVARDPGLVEALEQFTQLATQVRVTLMAQTADADFRALQAQVFQAIAAPAPRSNWLQRAWASVEDTWQWQRAGLLAPLAAAAAAGLLALGLPAITDNSGSAPASLTTAAEIHSLDTSETTAVVFQPAGSSVTVIWLAGTDEVDTEEGEEEEALDSDMPPEVESEVAQESTTATP
ncbi:MAG: hypothetical protein HY904_25605 [Deltaproteobacteria bacterium]|nr:hypothetical protein [Deltaproteobacteria bacterium]